MRSMRENRRGVAVLMLIFFGAVMGLLSVRNLADRLRVLAAADRFVETRGEVVDVVETRGRHGTSVLVRFAWEVDGERYESDNRITGQFGSRRELARHLSGPPGRERLRVFYDPESPEFGVLTTDPSLDAGIFTVVLSLLCFVVGVLLFNQGRRGQWPFEPKGELDPQV